MASIPGYWEKLEIKRFHNKSIAHSLDELWNQLFEDSYATRENVITPSMDPNVYEVVKCENLDGEKEDKEIDRKDTCYERDECVLANPMSPLKNNDRGINSKTWREMGGKMDHKLTT
ncbi:hypothetical protein JHK87_008371 [Glycine soja]|nr:hypothetical protein JHK87_008371 [Glycine soja]